MSGVMQSGPTLMPGDPRYEGIAAELALIVDGNFPRGVVPTFIHPLANLLPMMFPQHRSSFRASLAVRQNHPCVLHLGKMLDGRNRARELIELKKPISTVVFVGSNHDALEFVNDENFERRHLNESQRADYAARVVTMRLGTNQHTKAAAQICAPSLPLEDVAPDAAGEGPLLSTSEAAEKFNVSRRLVQHAVAYQQKGIPELSDAVRAGDVAASVASEIAERPIEQQKAILEALPRDTEGKLTPEAKKEIRKVAKEVRAEDQVEKKKKRAEREAKLGARIAALPDKKYGVILTDDEHRFIPYSQETGMDRAADNHYPTSDVATLAARDLDSIAADDCVLGSWVTDLARGIDVMRARGFEYKSYFVWVKDIIEIELTPEQQQVGLPGKVLIRVGNAGTGYWNRDRDELFLIGTRGKVVAPAMGEQGESVWFAARPALEPGEVSKHSKKCPNAHEWLEQHFPNTPKIELNARRARPGWDLWGNEAPEQPEQPSLDIDSREEAAA